MRERIGKLIVITVVMALSVGFFWLAVYAQSSGGASGPDTRTLPQVTATICPSATPTASQQTTLLSQSTVNPPSKVISDRLCYIVQNFSTANAVMVGDQVSATQGIALNPVPAAEPSSVGAVGDSATVCVTSVLNACGVGASAVVGVTEIRRP